jgi:hypothetical protein
MSRLPLGNAVLDGGLLVGGDVFAYTLAVGQKPCLIRPLY